MLTPGPDHPITIQAAKRRWRARYNGHVIADTGEALILQEASYPPVVYFPRDDIGMELMGRTERTTHCPYKGDAAYYSLDMDGQIAENVAWTYEQPYPAMASIGERLAFYTDKVDVYEVDDAADSRLADDAAEGPQVSVDEVILHTDSGAGVSQREHWPANVESPSADDGGLR